MTCSRYKKERPKHSFVFNSVMLEQKSKVPRLAVSPLKTSAMTLTLVMVLLSTELGISAATFTFSAISSRNLEAFSKFQIYATLHSSEDNQPVAFQFILQDVTNRTIAKSTVELSGPGQQVVELEVGELMDHNYNLAVRATSGNEVVERNVSLETSRQVGKILLQTDKPIYKPGETVKFRIFALSRSLLPLGKDTLVSLRMYDSKNYMIKQWPPLSTSVGFVAGQMQLSDEPNLGPWRLEADTEPRTKTKRISFSVAQYVLPKYNLSVSLSPGFVTFNDSETTVEVLATYPFRKGVNADCSVKLSALHMRLPSIVRGGRTDTDGKIRIAFDVKKDLKLNTTMTHWGPVYLKLFTLCTDKTSGHVRNESTYLIMHGNPYEIQIVEKPRSIPPGIPFNMTFKVSTKDNIPISDNGKKALKIVGWGSNKVIYKPIPSTGLVTLSFRNRSYDGVHVTYKSYTTDFRLPRLLGSSGGNYIQAKVVTQKNKIKEGDLVQMKLRANPGMGSVTVMVLSRGIIMKSEVFAVDNQDTLETDIEFTMPSNCYPRAQIFVYSYFSNEQLASDTVMVKVQPKYEVRVKVDHQTVEPGGNVSISCKLSQHSGTSIFGVRAVDQSVLLLDKHNRDSAAIHGMEDHSYDYCRTSFLKLSCAGLVLMTNSEGRRRHHRTTTIRTTSSTTERAEDVSDKEVAQETNGIRFGQFRPALRDAQDTFVSDQKGIRAPPSVRVRTHFPETWLFEHVETKGDHEVTLNKQIPDTLTSWVLDAFEINAESGLRVSQYPATTIRAFRPFFMSLNLPFSVVQGEILALQVSVHNYLDKRVDAKVTLSGNNGFEVKGVSAKQVSIQKDKIGSVTFPILFLKHGVVDLKLDAVTDGAGDGVVRTLKVIPPGIRHVQNDAIFINLLSTKKYEAEGLSAVFPKRRVKGADSVKVRVVGDLIGSVVNNLDNLIQGPGGCGEQNMASFAPIVSVLEYLNATGSRPKAIAVDLLEMGFQKQLTHLRKDGSYSTFQSNSVGSTWLTAFVARSFIKARRFIHIEDSVITRSLKFLMQRQSKDGSFAQKGFVHDNTLNGELPLTAFTLLTFNEAIKAGLWKNETVMSKGKTFILKTNKAKLDAYAANMVSYLLESLDAKEKDEFFKKSQQLAKVAEGEIYWDATKDPAKTTDNGSLVWHQYRNWPKSATVETTAYGLLSYLAKGPKTMEDCVKIVRWLVRARNEEGGYLSTQDTVVGLEALAKFAQLMGRSDPIDVEVSWKNGTHIFHVTKDNRMDMQEYTLSSDVGKLSLKGSFAEVRGKKGSAFAQLTWSYYVEKVEGGHGPFTLATKVKPKDKGRTVILNVCATYNGAGGTDSNMGILQASTPSGYVFEREDLETLQTQGRFKRYELEGQDTTMTLYFESFESGKNKCMDLTLYRMHVVAKLAPGQVKVYDYYDNTQKVEALYEVKGVPTLCDICKKDKTCGGYDECA